jgi:hypothetical protein
MDHNVPVSDEIQPRRRRRSSRKSSKASFQQRKRLKNIGFWLLTGLIGGVVVAGIAVLAGGSGN